jgi:hypothetical protein
MSEACAATTLALVAAITTVLAIGIVASAWLP